MPITSAQMERAETLLPRTARPCKIVTFYDRFADAIHAGKAFDCVVQNLGGNVSVQATSWSFDLLGRSELNATIRRDAALADVLVVATDGDRELPPRIAKWVNLCMNGNPDAKPVLVALHDDGREADDAAGPLCSSLKQIANRRHATFLCNTDLEQCPNHERALERAGRNEVRSIAARETAPPSPGVADRWWGLNE